MLIFIFLTIVLIYAVHYYYKYRDYYKCCNALPSGLKEYPIIGGALELGFNSTDIHAGIVRAWNNAGRKTFKIMLGADAMVFICTPENIEFLLSSNTLLDKSFNYAFLHPWIGEGLITAKGGPKWHTHRKIITPAFHFKILEQFVDVFSKESDILIEKLEQHHGKKEGVDIFPFVSVAALDSICETAMGIEIDAQHKDTPIAKAVAEICEAIHLRSFNPFLFPEVIFNMVKAGMAFKKGVGIMHKQTNEVLENRKKALKSQIEDARRGLTNIQNNIDDIGVKKRLAFLDILLLSTTPDGKSLTDEEIAEETNTFLFAGHDTTSSGIAFAMYVLAKHPDIQEKILEEQRELLGEIFSQKMTLRNCQEMKFLERVIKETMRMYPPVPMIGRNLTTKTTFPSGHTIPENAIALIAPILIHQNPDYFPNPSKFDPDRFLPENTRNQHTYAYIPFSAGPRNCIGQKYAMLEMKCMLAKIVQKLKLVEVKGFQPHLTLDLTMKSINGLVIALEKRQ